MCENYDEILLEISTKFKQAISDGIIFSVSSMVSFYCLTYPELCDDYEYMDAFLEVSKKLYGENQITKNYSNFIDIIEFTKLDVSTFNKPVYISIWENYMAYKEVNGDLTIEEIISYYCENFLYLNIYHNHFRIICKISYSCFGITLDSEQRFYIAGKLMKLLE